MNKEVEKLLNEQSLYYYDLLNETMHDIPDIENKAPLVKYIEYKRNGNTHDPDSKSNILQEIYKLLWGDLCDKWFMQPSERICSDKRICSDNMTSAQNFVNQAMKTEKLPKEKGQKHYSKKSMLKYYDNKKSQMRELFKSYGLDELVSVYHTIGNYCPVPRFFNSARAGYMNADYDFWDLTLMKIKEYYDPESDPEKKSSIIYDELFKTRKNPLPCKAWLDYFGSWKKFVNNNFFNSYVDDDYNVIPFWVGHSWKNIGLPENKKEFKKAVENIRQRIILRGLKIECKLWEKI